MQSSQQLGFKTDSQHIIFILVCGLLEA